MKLNDQIDLYAVFKNGKIVPIAFKWKGERYIVDEIGIQYTQKEGIFLIQYYSLIVQNSYFKISIHGKDNISRLHEVES